MRFQVGHFLESRQPRARGQHGSFHAFLWASFDESFGLDRGRREIRVSIEMVLPLGPSRPFQVGARIKFLFSKGASLPPRSPLVNDRAKLTGNNQVITPSACELHISFLKADDEHRETTQRWIGHASNRSNWGKPRAD